MVMKLEGAMALVKQHLGTEVARLASI